MTIRGTHSESYCHPITIDMLMKSLLSMGDIITHQLPLADNKSVKMALKPRRYSVEGI